jgi:fucose 4-O-acetylase-like acetyltransferase
MNERAVAAPSSRVEWADVARGVGIILVVYGHAARGLVAAGMLPDTPAVRLQDALIYAFHMPLFFLVSGLFAARSLRAGPGAFLRSRAATIVYPYFLWSLLQLTLQIAASAHTNRAADWGALTTILWQPIDQFWFLYALFLCQLCLLLPRRAFVVAVGIALILRLSLPNTNMLVRTCGDLPFFAAGVWIGAKQLGVLLDRTMRTAMLLLLSVGLFAAAFVVRQHGLAPAYLAHLGTGFSGLFAVLALSRLTAPYGWSRPLALLGGASMPIFLAHVIAAAAIRLVLKRLAPELPLPLLLLAVTIAGLVLPYVAWRIADRLSLTRWLGWPANRRSDPKPEPVIDAP